MTPDRSSPEDARALLAEVSEHYDLNGQRIPAGPFRESVISPLTRSRDPHVRKAAQSALELGGLRARLPRMGGPAPAEFRRQTQRLTDAMLRRVLERATDPSAESDLRAAARVIEEVGSDLQRAANATRALELLESELKLCLRDDLRALQLSLAATASVANPTLAVRLDSERRGLVTITNVGGLPLHHCLILTRLEADLEKVRRNAQLEDSVGLGLGGLFSGQTIEAARLSARLTHLREELDKGRQLYVPEFAPGAVISAGFASVVYFARSRAADISLWSDEGSVERKPVENLAELQKPRRPRSTAAAIPAPAIHPSRPGSRYLSAPGLRQRPGSPGRIESSGVEDRPASAFRGRPGPRGFPNGSPPGDGNGFTAPPGSRNPGRGFQRFRPPQPPPDGR